MGFPSWLLKLGSTSSRASISKNYRIWNNSWQAKLWLASTVVTQISSTWSSMLISPFISMQLSKPIVPTLVSHQTGHLTSSKNTKSQLLKIMRKATLVNLLNFQHWVKSYYKFLRKFPRLQFSMSNRAVLSILLSKNPKSSASTFPIATCKRQYQSHWTGKRRRSGSTCHPWANWKLSSTVF